MLAGGYWAYTAYERRSPVRQSITNTSAKPVVAALNVTVLDVQSSALLADAQGRHRPEGEIDSLTDSNNQIAAAASQMHGLGIKPGDRAKVRSLLTQMKNLAVDMSHNEATALEKAGAQLWQDLAKPPKGIGTDAEAAIAKARQAKANLDGAVSAVQQAQDGTVSLKATTQALAAYDAFAAACEVAAPFYVSARRSDFAAVAATAHSISDQLVALGRVSKPSWLFASHARKDAYQTLTANATDAQSQVVQLDELGRRVDAATNIRKISADISRASAIKARLGRLLTSSNAAYSVYNQ